MDTIKTLPTDVILKDILPRCEARTLLRFKCVSKSFNAYISGSEFINLHLQNCLTCNSNRILILIFERNISCIDLDSQSLPVFSLPLREHHFMVGTCNGLVCLRVRVYSFTLINPCTGMYVESPDNFFQYYVKVKRQKHWYDCRQMNFGFGYDSRRHDYKAIVIMTCTDDENHVPDYEVDDDSMSLAVFIYSFKANSWRSVLSPSHSWDLAKREENGVLINNHLLHWLLWCPDNNELRISCFDLETEQWVQDIPLPVYDGNSGDPHYANRFFMIEISKDLVQIGVFDKCLCLLKKIRRESAVVDVWVMKEYGVKESWVKLLGGSDLCVTEYLKFCPLAYRSIAKDEVLVRRFDKRRNDDEFVWYNMRDQRYHRTHQIQTVDRCFTARENLGYLDACICNGSLVALPGGRQMSMEQHVSV